MLEQSMLFVATHVLQLGQSVLDALLQIKEFWQSGVVPSTPDLSASNLNSSSETE